MAFYPRVKRKVHAARHYTPGAGVVSEVNYTTTFEAQTQLIIGLEKKTAYSVTYLKDPSRVVIDFQN